MSAGYYQENKEKLQEKSHESFEDLSEEEKNKNRKHGHEHYKNLSEDEKQRVVEYRKN